MVETEFRMDGMDPARVALEQAMEASAGVGASVAASVAAEALENTSADLPVAVAPVARVPPLASSVRTAPSHSPPPQPQGRPRVSPPPPASSSQKAAAAEDEEGGDDGLALRPVFLEEPPEHVKCGICYELLLRRKGPVQMSCGHLFCRECLGRAFARKRQCPQCRMATPAGQPFEACVSRSLLCSQVIDALPVRCPYGIEVVNGVETERLQVRTGGGESLLDVIGGSTTPSPGDASVLRRGATASSALDGAIMDSSEYLVLGAPRVREREGGCRETLKLGNLEGHVRECQHARVRCPHRLLGCTFEGLRAHLESHVVSECEYEKVSKCLAVERSHQRKQAAELEERLGARMAQLEATVKTLKDENRRLKGEQMRQGAALFASGRAFLSAGMPGPVLSSIVTAEGDLSGPASSASGTQASRGVGSPWSAVPAWRGGASSSRLLRPPTASLPADVMTEVGSTAANSPSPGPPASPPTPNVPATVSRMPLAPPGKVTHIVTPSTSPAAPTRNRQQARSSPQDPVEQQPQSPAGDAGAVGDAGAAPQPQRVWAGSQDLAVAHHSTLGSALKAAGHGDVIFLQAGTYIESVSVLKGVTIVGEGLPELLLPAGEALLCDAEGVELRGLCIRSCDAGAPDGYALRVRGGSLTLKGCDVASARLSCVIVMGGSRAVLQGNRIHGSGQDGVIVGGGGVATLRGNEIFGHVLSGVEVTGAETRVELFGNIIHSNQQAGVYVHDRAHALVQGCHIFSNDKVNVNATSEGKIVLRDNLISVGRQHGAYATGGGKLIAERNRILANAFSGLCVEGGGFLVADGNEVQLNRMWGICIGEGANRCQLGPCDMRGNALGGLNAPPEALASIRSIENRRQGEALIRELGGGVESLGLHGGVAGEP